MIVNNFAEIQQVLAKMDPIIKDQKKLLQNKENLSKNILSKSDVAAFLKTFEIFYTVVSTLQKNLANIQELSQSVENNLILHYQKC